VRQVLGAAPAELLAGIVRAIDAADARGVLERVGQLATEGYELAHFCGELTRFGRDLMVARSCGAESPLLQVPDDQRRQLGELAGLFSEEDLSRFFNILLRTETEMRYSLVPRFHLELALMKLVHARRLSSIESLLGGLSGSGLPGKSSNSPRAPVPTPARSAPATAPKLHTGSFDRPPATASVQAPPPAAEMPAAPAENTSPALPATPASEDGRLAAIKTAVYSQSNFLGSCLEHLSGFRIEEGQVDFIFAQKDSFYADLVKASEQLAILRSACIQVLGQPVRICVRLNEQAGAARTERPTARARAERDPGVDVFRKKFDGTVVDVKDLKRE
jgi:DNA polymerase-3 subunit gamma/tau